MCRSRVNHEFQVDGEYQKFGRFNYGVVTLNLPHIALEVLSEQYAPSNYNRDPYERFLDSIRYYSSTVMKNAFLTRYEYVSKLKAKEAPILFVHGGIARLNPEDTIAPLLKTDRASLSYGFIGIDDCVRLLTDDMENISTEKGQAMGLEIMKLISEMAERLKEDTGLPISVYGTPAEASIGTFFEKDKEQFGAIMPKWLLKREYYTNSFHFSSELPIDPFDKIKAESKFTALANGGNISYVENGGKIYNTDAIIELIQYANACRTQYFAINTISDVCYDCGYVGEMKYDAEHHQYTCPQCGNHDGSKMKVQRRCCGYISNYNITQAVKGRMKEIENRFVHTK